MKARYLVVNIDKHQDEPHYREELDAVELRDCYDGNTMIVDLVTQMRYYRGKWSQIPLIRRG